jgi:hypothetical protein
LSVGGDNKQLRSLKQHINLRREAKRRVLRGVGTAQDHPRLLEATIDTTSVLGLRYLAGILGVAIILIGLMLFGVDLAEGMPWWWSLVEGPFKVGFGVVILVLSWRVGGKE